MSSHRHSPVISRPYTHHGMLQSHELSSVSIRDVEIGDIVGLCIVLMPFLTTLWIVTLFSTPTWFQDIVLSPMIFGVILVWISTYIWIERRFASSWKGSNFVTDVVTGLLTSCVVEQSRKPLYKLVQVMWRIVVLPVFFPFGCIFYTILCLLDFVVVHAVCVPLKRAWGAICSADQDDHQDGWPLEMKEAGTHSLAPKRAFKPADDAQSTLPGTFCDEQHQAAADTIKKEEAAKSDKSTQPGHKGHVSAHKPAPIQPHNVPAAAKIDEGVLPLSPVLRQAAPPQPQHFGQRKAQDHYEAPQKTKTNSRVQKQAHNPQNQDAATAREPEVARPVLPLISVDASTDQTANRELEEMKLKQAKLEAELAAVTGERDNLSIEVELARTRAVKDAEALRLDRLEKTMAENAAEQNQQLQTALRSEKDSVVRLLADLQSQVERATKAETDLKTAHSAPGLSQDQAAEYQQMQAAVSSGQAETSDLKAQVLAQSHRANQAEQDLAVAQQDRQNLDLLFQTIAGDHRDKTIMFLGSKCNKLLIRYQAAEIKTARLEKSLKSSKENHGLFGELVKNDLKQLQQQAEQLAAQNSQLESTLKARDLEIEELKRFGQSNKELIQKLMAGDEKPKAETKAITKSTGIFGVPMTGVKAEAKSVAKSTSMFGFPMTGVTAEARLVAKPTSMFGVPKMGAKAESKPIADTTNLFTIPEIEVEDEPKQTADPKDVLATSDMEGAEEEEEEEDEDEEPIPAAKRRNLSNIAERKIKMPVSTKSAFGMKTSSSMFGTKSEFGSGGNSAFGVPQKNTKYTQIEASGGDLIPKASTGFSALSNQQISQALPSSMSVPPPLPQNLNIPVQSPGPLVSRLYDPAASLARQKVLAMQRTTAGPPVNQYGPNYAPGKAPAPQAPSRLPSPSLVEKPGYRYIFGKWWPIPESIAFQSLYSNTPPVSATPVVNVLATTQTSSPFVSHASESLRQMPLPGLPATTPTTTQATGNENTASMFGPSIAPTNSGAKDVDKATSAQKDDDDDEFGDLYKAQADEEENEKRRGRGERGW